MKPVATAVFFATDLHGSDVCFRKFLAAGRFYGASVLFLGGDLSGKGLVWIRRRLSGGWQARVDGSEVSLSTEAERNAFQERMANRGLYAAEQTGGEAQEDAAKVLESQIVRRAQVWMERASDVVRTSGVQLFVIPGNDDPWSIDSVLRGCSEINFIDRRAVTVTPGIQVVGLGCSTHTPWNTPREFTEEQIKSALSTVLANRTADQSLIFDIHIPPYGSGIDVCPELNEDKQVRMGPGGPMLQPVGSHAVRAAIKEYEPVLGLFGHVHESRGFTTIGKTLCVNPGSSYSEGRLLGALVTFENGRVRSWQLTEG